MLARTDALGFVSVLLAIVVGCGDVDSLPSTTQSSSSSTEAAAAPVAKTLRIEFRRNAARNEFDIFADDGAGLTRVRILRTAATELSDEEDRRYRERQWAAYLRRQTCLERTRRAAPTAEDRHDAWLEVCSKLERAAAEDPADLSIQRDLLHATVSLLSFERDSPFASALCRSACDRLAQFVDATQTQQADEADAAASAEAWLYFHKKLYPAAAESLERIREPAARRPLADALDALKQRRFLPLETWTVERSAVDSAAVGKAAGETAARNTAIVRAFRTIGSSPDGELVWPEYHFLVSPSAGAATPARTIGYTLSVRSGAAERSFYLRYHAFGESDLVYMYGSERPSYSVVKQHVNDLILAASKQPRGNAAAAGGAP